MSRRHTIRLRCTAWILAIAAGSGTEFGTPRCQAELQTGGSRILQSLEIHGVERASSLTPHTVQEDARGDGAEPRRDGETGVSGSTLPPATDDANVPIKGPAVAAPSSGPLAAFPYILLVVTATAGALWFWERYGRRRRGSVEFPFAYEPSSESSHPRSRHKRPVFYWLASPTRARRHGSVDFPFIDVEVVEKRRRR